MGQGIRRCSRKREALVRRHQRYSVARNGQLAILAALPIKKICGFPLAGPNRVLGALALGRLSENAFTDA